MIHFRQRNFGFTDSMWRGTLGGATLGGMIGGAVKSDKLVELFGMGVDKFGKHSWGQRALAATLTGAVVGASLGLLAEGMKRATDKSNRNSTLDQRLLNIVVENLKKQGFREGEKFTRDPKEASEKRIKVCISVARVNSDLKLIINTIKDPKLKDLSDTMIKRIPNTGVVRQDMKDKFNEISVTSISDASADAGLITGIAEFFIRNGYPVYLVEVG